MRPKHKHICKFPISDEKFYSILYCLKLYAMILWKKLLALYILFSDVISYLLIIFFKNIAFVQSQNKYWGVLLFCL